MSKEAVKLRLADAIRNERHNNVAETRYWLDQYKQIATASVAAQQKPWVELTDEERQEIWKGCDPQHAGYVTALVEAKLREKNGGAAQPADHTEEYLDMVRALDALLVVQDEPCSIDHHGYCQSHYLDNVNSYGGCRVANARALVAKVRGKP